MNNTPAKFSYYTGRNPVTMSPAELHAEIVLVAKAMRFARLGCLAAVAIAAIAALTLPLLDLNK